MNFYIGNSINSLDVTQDNVEFSDELLDFICKKGKQLSYDMGKMYEIDPYDDLEISSTDLPLLIESCSRFLHNSILQDYSDPDEGIQTMEEFIQIAQQGKMIFFNFIWRFLPSYLGTTNHAYLKRPEVTMNMHSVNSRAI